MLQELFLNRDTIKDREPGYPRSRFYFSPFEAIAKNGVSPFVALAKNDVSPFVAIAKNGVSPFVASAKKGSTLTLFLTLLLLPFSSYSSIENNFRCRQALNYALDLKYASAKELLEEESLKNPSNNFRLYIENYIDFLELTLGEDPAQFKYRKENFAKRIRLIQKEDDSSPLKSWVIGDMYFQDALVRFRFGEYMNGAASARKAYLHLEKSRKTHPEIRYHDKYLGLMKVVLASVPSEYKWLLDLLGFNGDQQAGMKMLRSFGDPGNHKDPFAREAEMLTLFALMNFHDPAVVKEEAMPLINKLKTGSPLEIFFAGTALFKVDGNEEALKILEKVDAGNLPFLLYLRGVAFLQKLNIEKAEASFMEFLSTRKGQDYVRAAYHKIAWCRLLDNDHAGYFNNMKQALRNGVSTIDEDKLAFNEATKGKAPVKQLLKARLLTDGGYYEEARQILLRSSSVIIEPEQEIEYCYRFARIYHKQEKFEKAKSYYRLVLKNDPKNSTYYPVSSALQLGVIFEKQGNISEAKKYFNYCLENDPPDYKASLHQKAKAGLVRISQLAN